MLRHPVFKLDSKAIERSFPIPDRHRPFFADISNSQVEQFEQCLVRRTRATVFGDFLKLMFSDSIALVV
jgi:hypothetical protein